MAKTIIDVGTNANDGTGDPLRTAMQSTNSNFNEVYTLFGNGSTLALSGDVSVSGGTATIGSGAVTGTKVANDTIALTNLADIKINDTTDVIYTDIIVTVVNPGSGNKYYYDGANQVITLSKGQTYRFDQSAGTNSGHPLRFSTTSNGTHSGGSAYSTNVTAVGTPGNAGAYTQITTEQDTPTLYTYCTAHSGMGNTVSYGASLDSRGLVSQIGLDTNDYINVQSDQINFFLDGSEDMRLQDSGTLQVEGDVVAYSTVISSDEKLKNNVETIDGALEKVKELKGVTFNYKSNGKASGGIIAQDVEKVMPSLIKTQNTLDGSDTFKTVDYNGLIGLLIESVKELSDKLDECNNCKKD
jgi:lipopolysaccharide export system protein LptA